LGVEECKLVELPVVEDRQGNLAFAEELRHVPFSIARIYYVYDVPNGAVRGGHAHRELEQMIVGVAGKFEIVVDDGSARKRFTMESSRVGLYMPPMVWHELVDFSAGSAYFALASAYYDEADYYRDYGEFKAAAGGA
jgi:dTDP-4-dehydrorhamnose 3,5-epimerase-like enzyme